MAPFFITLLAAPGSTPVPPRRWLVPAPADTTLTMRSYRDGQWFWVMVLGVTLTGCGSDDEVGPGGAGSTATGGSGGAGGSGGSASGAGGGGGSGAGGVNPLGIYGVGNLDDDDENGQADWEDALFDGDNDIATFTLPADLVAQVQPADTVELSLTGQVDEIRIWHGTETVLGAGASGSSHVLSGADAGAELRAEFADFLSGGTLTVRHLGGGDTELQVIEMPLRSAPLAMNHHRQPAEHVWAVQTNNNGDMVQAFQAVLGSRFTVIQNSDRWIQDELEWATATAPGMRMDIAMDSIRDRNLDAWVKGLEAPDVQPITWGVAGTDTTEDKFGNLEAAPAHTAGGVSYTHGRIYYGATDQVGPTDVLTTFLDDQLLQAPLRLDVEWLCVGHVDEFLTFIPDPSSAKGFKLLYADVDAAYAVLQAMNPSTSIPRYSGTHGYSTVGALLNDNQLTALNTDVQDDYLTPILDQLKAALDLDESDVIRIPSLFERVNCSYSSAWMETAALIPGMVNLTAVNVEGEPIHLFIPDPFMRGNGDPQSADPVIAAVQAQLPGYELHFVDDWYGYHVMMGEVHCGTNVTRTPTADWWAESMHLLGGQ